MHEQEKQARPPLTLIDDAEYKRAQEILNDPAQIAPVDTGKLGRKLAEILTRTNSERAKSQGDDD
jgi:hypothetical protein